MCLGELDIMLNYDVVLIIITETRENGQVLVA